MNNSKRELGREIDFDDLHISDDEAQAPASEVFKSARDIFESLQGTRIQNVCPELTLSVDSEAIEFDYYSYDFSNREELAEIGKQVGEKVLFFGIGYDIIGDWLVGESGKIYFRDKIRNRLSLMTDDIYDLLERTIYSTNDIYGEDIFR
jgi:hypothetical protein